MRLVTAYLVPVWQWLAGVNSRRSQKTYDNQCNYEYINILILQP